MFSFCPWAKLSVVVATKQKRKITSHSGKACEINLMPYSVVLVSGVQF
jgi:hypothetical protein